MALPHAKTDAHTAEIGTLLGRGSEFEGKLTFEGAVRIDGKLAGEIFSDGVLIVGEGAEVAAEIDIGEIIVQGMIIGNIRAKRGIELKAPGRVKGDLTTPSLQIDKGVIFEGKCFMEGIVDGARPRATAVTASGLPAIAQLGGHGSAPTIGPPGSGPVIGPLK